MKGGTIKNNIIGFGYVSRDRGGAVTVNGGTFIMQGGVIEKNSVTNDDSYPHCSGGVFLDQGYSKESVFIKTGGIIRGVADDPVNGNAVLKSSGTVNPNGAHAVQFYGRTQKYALGILYRQNTAGENDDMDSRVESTAGFLAW
jgi:hypothetical protein